LEDIECLGLAYFIAPESNLKALLIFAFCGLFAANAVAIAFGPAGKADGILVVDFFFGLTIFAAGLAWCICRVTKLVSRRHAGRNMGDLPRQFGKESVGWILKVVILCILTALIYGWYEDGNLSKVATGFGSSPCKKKWAKSGFETQWDLASGCQVYVRNRWIPEANVQVQP
jgi:hypothetical protein